MSGIPELGQQEESMNSTREWTTLWGWMSDVDLLGRQGEKVAGPR